MDYKIFGSACPAVTCILRDGESMITESGAMSWMSSNMKMETTSGGGLGKVFGRMFSGENLFQNRYTAVGSKGEITFASSFVGEIRAVEIAPDKPIIVQKAGFLASEAGVDLSIHFQKKIGSGLFGGEGFIMQKLSGRGTAFIEIDGSAAEYTLAAGEEMIVDTGYLIMMDATCSLEIVTVPGIKNMVFGGEGIFNTIVRGPGKITLQTMPISAVANSIIPYIPTSK